MKTICLYICLLGLITTTTMAQEKYVPSQENLEAREWFEDARFGMFIHWGVYSILGDGEWVMNNQDIPAQRYRLLPSFFNPTEFDAQAIVSLAKEAGMKYITFTSKHHDGLAMYDSRVSDYTVVKSTPYKKDVLRLLEEACKEQGLKLFVYYSQLDWDHPDFYPRGWTGRKTGRPETGDWDAYLDYQDAQIRELAENYDIAGFWFDGWWDQAPHKEDWHREVDYRISGNDWKLSNTYQMIHQINSALLIGNNHHEMPFEGEDFQMFEKDLPGANTTGFGGAGISQLPLESCQTMNTSWGFNLQDTKEKSKKELIQFMVQTFGNGANLLLNVGPMPNGKIQPQHVENLKFIGQWMDQYGQTIYQTQKGPVSIEGVMTSTQKDKRVYLHFYGSYESDISLHGLDGKIKEVLLYKDQSKIKYKKNKQGVTIEIPENKQDSIVTVVEVVLK
ncbi:alpha-L-fucosidase [Galbibacter marinus]|uniref:alpha-L-fucosidase n=1 Tax=Galbibacter marinus TaxID=555500 RepID=K2QLU4_9FLAO|nr:alpha-L-fucosidase [Galbibacter marinus]EKF55757.1 alpha-L-fucosidase [Galbibacter marinus]